MRRPYNPSSRLAPVIAWPDIPLDRQILAFSLLYLLRNLRFAFSRGLSHILDKTRKNLVQAKTLQVGKALTEVVAETLTVQPEILYGNADGRYQLHLPGGPVLHPFVKRLQVIAAEGIQSVDQRRNLGVGLLAHLVQLDVRVECCMVLVVLSPLVRRHVREGFPVPDHDLEPAHCIVPDHVSDLCGEA